MEKITKQILEAKKNKDVKKVQQLQQKSDMSKKYTFLKNDKIVKLKIKSKDLRYCQRKECNNFINPSKQDKNITIYQYRRRKYCDKKCACIQRNLDYCSSEETNMKKSLAMFTYYANKGLYDMEKDGSLPYSSYKRHVQKRSKSTLKRDNLILYNIYIDNPWNPKKPNENDLTIEHKIPIRQCYDCGISIKQASNLNNLEIITMKQNWENNNGTKKDNS